MWWWLLVAVCACGRIGFDPLAGDDAGSGSGTDGGGSGSGPFQYVQGASATATTGMSLDVPVVPQRNNSVNVVVIGSADSDVTSVTDDAGTTYTRVVGPTVTGAVKQWTYVGAVGEAPNLNVVHVMFDQVAMLPGAMVAEYTGADGNVPGTSSAMGQSSTSAAGTLFVLSAPALIVAANTNAQPGTAGPGAGYTERVRSEFDDIIQDQVVATAGTYVATAPLTTNHVWTMQAIALSPR